MSRTRSTKGCWTCKLRKKKCDEGKPACYACLSFQLGCDGYGPRPEWMDDGSKEKKRAANIQEIVKEATRQKKRAAMLLHQIKKQPMDDKVLAKPARLDLQIPLPSTFELPSSLSQVDAERVKSLPKLIDGPIAGIQPENAAAYVAQNETVLLMHYLDHVFPLQFRFYESSLEEGGRGWLLSLLLECKPLYHAACSLAAYHRQVTYCLREGMMRPCFTREALNGQYDKAISELRRFLENLVLSDRERTFPEELRLLCSIVIFISIEAFTSSPEWRVHLAAAISLFPKVYPQLRRVRLAESPTPTCRAALSFFAAVGLWYEIISCTTTASLPFEPSNYQVEEADINFENAMGCEAWAVAAIKEIAGLNHWKNTMKAAGQLSMRELVNRGNEIEAKLINGLEKISNTTKEQLEIWVRERSCFPKRYLRCVTRVYCCAGLIQLHVVVSGPHPELPEIRHRVEQTIEAFKGLPDTESVNSLVWPLCIAGCMASGHDQDFFQKLARSANPSDSMMGAAKARIIMEECWRLRKLDPGSGNVDWRTAMESLDFKILLV
ncbi:fungal-specific transcription factor domain-containing protein [Tricladium varicosporioides]|nr:fungal-specific transcription factor domain-containing protein [Hymenoscyphus varicosporioides]